MKSMRDVWNMTLKNVKKIKYNLRLKMTQKNGKKILKLSEKQKHSQ